MASFFTQCSCATFFVPVQTACPNISCPSSVAQRDSGMLTTYNIFSQLPGTDCQGLAAIAEEGGDSDRAATRMGRRPVLGRGPRNRRSMPLAAPQIARASATAMQRGAQDTVRTVREGERRLSAAADARVSPPAPRLRLFWVKGRRRRRSASEEDPVRPRQLTPPGGCRAWGFGRRMGEGGVALATPRSLQGARDPPPAA